MENKLIHNWKEAWKMLSVQANTVGIALAAQYAAMYDQMKELFPPKVMMMVVAIMFAIGIIARITKQSNITTVPKEEATDAPKSTLLP